MRDVTVIKDCSVMIKPTFSGVRVGLRIESGKVGGRTCQLELIGGSRQTFLEGDMASPWGGGGNVGHPGRKIVLRQGTATHTLF